MSPDAYSQGEVLRHREFDRMTPAELREAERLVDALIPKLERRRTRRYELHSHGRRLAPRAMFRRNLGTGGQLMSWVWRRQIREPRSLVVLCDISGSMERHSRLLLRFVQALSAASEVRTESFVFGTRLTRVTRLLRDRDRDRALARVADSVNDWAGGTRIGESFRTFNQHWARRSLRTSGVVIVVSDGWDRGDPALVATETARLRRNCHRLVWLNPLAGTPGYQPLAGGMRAAYPYIDDFLPAGTVASLERLGEILGGVRAGDTRRGSEAAAHAALPGAAVPAVAGLPSSSVVRPSTRPLRGHSDEGTARHPGRLAERRHDPADVGRAVVVRTFGSAPRPEGAVLLYAATAGSRARSAAAASKAPRPRRSTVPGRPATPASSATGSAMSRRGTWVSPAAARSTSSSSRSPRRSSSRRRGVRSAPAGTVRPWSRRSPPIRHRAMFGAHEPGDGAPPAPELVVGDDGTLEGTLGSPELDAALVEAATAALRRGLSRTVELGDRSLFIEVFPVRPRLVLVGGVEVARSLVRLARELGYETVVVDGRAAFATPERFPDVDRLVVGWPDEVADEIGLGPNDAVAVLSHDVKFDEPAIVEALRRGCRYVGAVGSRKTQADRRARLLEAGVDPVDLARLHGPIGLDLGGRAPAETALAILAEIVAERYGGTGRPMLEQATRAAPAALATA